MQECFAGRIQLMACDFTPPHIEHYYAALFSALKRRGTVAASFVRPEMSLHNGRYEMKPRDGPAMAREVYCVLQKCAGARR